jgi:carbon-monoxide dehydrogenase catalytic subunit
MKRSLRTSLKLPKKILAARSELVCIRRALLSAREWRSGVVPRGIDREVVEIMHRTHMGVDQDFTA